MTPEATDDDRPLWRYLRKVSRVGVLIPAMWGALALGWLALAVDSSDPIYWALAGLWAFLAVSFLLAGCLNVRRREREQR